MVILLLYPELGEKARNNGHVVYSLDFEVTPHQLRHTYITNLIHSSVDPKTVQYLAGHESSKITMDIYAKVKYNRPDELVRTMGNAFAFASFRHSAKQVGRGIFLSAAFVFNSSRITGLLFSVCHARRPAWQNV